MISHVCVCANVCVCDNVCVCANRQANAANRQANAATRIEKFWRSKKTRTTKAIIERSMKKGLTDTFVKSIRFNLFMLFILDVDG